MLLFTPFYSVFAEGENANTNSNAEQVSSFMLDQQNITVEKGRLATIQAILKTGEDEQSVSPSEIEWSSEDDSVAAVYNGKVSGVRTGGTVITAIYLGFEAKVEVTVTKASVNTKTGPKFQLFELVSNAGKLDELLKNFSVSELKVEVPEQVIKEASISTNDFTTNVEVTVSPRVKRVEIRSLGHSFDAIRNSTNHYERSMAGLKVGDELTIRAYDAEGKELQLVVFKLSEQPITFEESYGLLTKKVYTFKELTENIDLFNELLRLYSLSDLQVTAPLRYIDEVSAEHTTWFTSFKIQTFAPAEQIIIEINNKEYETKYLSDGLYTREVTGVKDGDLATVKVLDEFGNVIEKRVITIES